jgi:hypothetical protein
MIEQKDKAEPSGASAGYPQAARPFLLFGGPCYYARGGFHDFISSHPTAKEAFEEAIRLESQNKSDSVEWWQIWDCDTNSIVAVSGVTAYGADKPWPTLDGMRDG